MKKLTALIAAAMALLLSACEKKDGSGILIPYDEELCCDNEIALQELTGDVFYDSDDLEKYADFDYYCLISKGKADIPLSDDESFRINYGNNHLQVCPVGRHYFRI